MIRLQNDIKFLKHPVLLARCLTKLVLRNAYGSFTRLLKFSVVGIKYWFVKRSMCQRRRYYKHTTASIMCLRSGEQKQLFFAGLLYGAGLATYTVEQTTNVLHNPHGYLTQMGSGMQSSFQDIMGGGGHSSMGGLSGYSTGGAGKRKRRQAMLDEGFDAPHNEESVDPADLQKKALAMFKNMDPVFGYSYYIAWLGFVFAILSIVFSVLSVVQKQLLYADDVDPLPVF